MSTFEFRQGGSVLVVSIPHSGTYFPSDIAAHMTDTGRAVPDTDWHVHLLYDFLDAFDATVLAATHSRYVVDLNRDPEGGRLYPGRFETGVCPKTTFAGEPIWQVEPSAAEIASRIETCWRPYHAQLAAALDATRAKHGYALLLDAHSIMSAVPTLFEGHLPDLSLGTNSGASCDARIEQEAMASFAEQGDFSFVANGRFKGGYITRHYGNPTKGVHALQLEIGMRAYLDESAPRDFDPARAKKLKNVLRDFVTAIVEAASAQHAAHERGCERDG
jgi:N-formylglutamate deformylase